MGWVPSKSMPLWTDDCGDTTELFLDDIDLDLATHNGDVFGVYGDVVRYTPAVPPPIDATISDMRSGRVPYLTGDSPVCYERTATGGNAHNHRYVRYVDS